MGAAMPSWVRDAPCRRARPARRRPAPIARADGVVYYGSADGHGGPANTAHAHGGTPRAIQNRAIHHVKLVFIGDIVGKPGRRAVQQCVPRLRALYDPLDAVIANAENAAGGRGLTAKIAKELTGYGVDFMTTGNHVWDQKQFLTEIDGIPNVVRPLNVPDGTPGSGSATFETRSGIRVGVVNLAGSLFMNYDSPFPAALPTVRALGEEADVVVVDMHAEATSEKVAMGWHLDGHAALVVGTHTHVQTADERVLPKGCAYITDLGMTGSHDSVIGVGVDMVLQKFLTQLPAKFEVATENVQLCGVYVEIDEGAGRATSIERLRISCEDE